MRDDTKIGAGSSPDRRGLRVFLSYAHHDLRMAERMHVHLMALVRSGLVAEMWFDRDLRAAQTWDDEIEQAIARSDIFILFVSPDYIASDFIMTREVPRIRERLRIANGLLVPIILRPCMWESVAGAYQVVPMEKGRVRPVSEWKPVDSGYNTAAEQIRNATEWHFPGVRARDDAYPGPRRLTDEQIDHAVRAVVGRRPAKV